MRSDYSKEFYFRARKIKELDYEVAFLEFRGIGLLISAYFIPAYPNSCTWMHFYLEDSAIAYNNR